MKVPLEGGTPIQQGLEQRTAFGVGFGGVSLYWSSATAGGSLQRINLGGGMPQNLGAVANSPPLVVTSEAVFYLDCPVKDGLCVGVRRLPLGGGQSEVVSAGAAQAWPAANSSHVYWASATTLYRLPILGNSSTVIASDQFNINGIAVDESAVFWAILTNGGNIMKADLDGKNAVPIAVGPGAPNSVTVDDDTVYWAENGMFGSLPTVIAMTARAGGARTVLYSARREDVGSCSRPITDEKAIYWLVTGYDIDKPGMLLKMAKP